VSYLARIPAVFGTVFRNPELRRVELAFAAFNGAEWAVWLAMLVYAYEQGGATEAGIVAFVQLVPATLFAPFASALADRYRPAGVLAGGYAVQAMAMVATAAAVLGGAPAPIAYAFAAAAATAVTVTRPAQATLLPGLVRSPDELTATNVVSGWIESAAVLIAPAAAGVIIGVWSPGVVFAVMAALVAAGAAAVAPTIGPPPAAVGVRARPSLDVGGRGPAVLLGVLGTQYLLIGALDVLYVVLALGVLDLGGSGAGYLNAAFGAGGTFGVAATVALVGRKRISVPMAAGTAAFSLALVAIGVWPTAVAAFLLLAVAGVGRSLLDVAGRTLLQRMVPPDVLGRIFGLLESLAMAGLALGSLLVPALVGLGGARTACIVLGSLLLVAAAACGRVLLALDRAATVPVVELSLLRSLPLFRPLGVPELETLARTLEPVEVEAGTAVIRTGERGDRFYAIADGTVEVSRDGRPVGTLTRGDGFGEIALLRDVPRTADIVALTPTRLYALAKHDFVAAVTGHPVAAAESDRLVRERLEANTAIVR
jgi:MFS family permease